MSNSSAPLDDLAQAVLAWFDRNARDLPWRRETDPYRIWLSEVMLQQTQVSVVIPYYERFVAAYPRLEDLAAADETAVLELWAGLGYYRRAQNLLRAARVIRDEFGGTFPQAFDQAIRLPGIGRYSAGAVLSIAFGLPHPVLDGNVRRVFTRYLNLDPAVRDSNLWELLERLIRKPETAGRPGDFNQGLMELGATVCTPRRPACTACPLASGCAGRADGAEVALPISRRPKQVVVEEYTALVIRQDDCTLMRHRAEAPYLEGFWELPTLDGMPSAEDLPDLAQRRLGLEIEVASKAPLLRHRITYRNLYFQSFRCRLLSPALQGTFRWVRPSSPGFPISSATRKLLAQSD